MRVLIVIDNHTNRLLYKKAIEKIPEINGIEECDTAEDALYLAIQKKPDIIITAGRLPKRSGLKLCAALSEINHKAVTIVFTDDEKYAIDAIKTKVFRFEIIPVNQDRIVGLLKEAIEFIQHKQCNQPDKNHNATANQVTISTKNGFVLVDLDQIAYMEADGSYTTIFFLDGTKLYSSYNMGRIEQSLMPYYFARISRSIIINLKLIRKIDKVCEVCEIEINGKAKKLKISRTCMKKMELRNIL